MPFISYLILLPCKTTQYMSICCWEFGQFSIIYRIYVWYVVKLSYWLLADNLISQSFLFLPYMPKNKRVVNLQVERDCKINTIENMQEKVSTVSKFQAIVTLISTLIFKFHHHCIAILKSSDLRLSILKSSHLRLSMLNCILLLMADSDCDKILSI